MEKDSRSNHIVSISVSKLFGLYSYRVPKIGSISELAIIYADNGAGKTTLLRLVFQLLSTARNMGHKSAICKTIFSELEVGLSNGILIKAKKQEGILAGPTTFEIVGGKDISVKWTLIPGEVAPRYAIESEISKEVIKKIPASMRRQVENEISKRDFFEKLSGLGVSCSILTPDRMLLGDESNAIGIDSDLMAKVRSGGLAEAVLAAREVTLSKALDATFNWTRRQALRSAYSGGDSVNSVYQEIVVRIATTPFKTKTGGLTVSQKEKIIKDVGEKLKDLDKKYFKFSEYALAPKIQIAGIIESISGASNNKVDLINSVLEPYLNSLEARAKSLDPVYEIIDSFVKNINKFLKEKSLQYRASYGFQIISSHTGKALSVSQLSSGEQQLLIMFCHVLSARDSSTIFIIDEPEISLNIKWQRMLVSSLLDVSKGADIQLIFASHSFEILSKHEGRVVSLESASESAGDPVVLGDEV